MGLSGSMKNENEEGLAVVVVTYNAGEYIDRCLYSLSRSSLSIDIIVVDNASSDDTISRIQSFQDVNLIRLEANIGFGRANNIGIEEALRNNANLIILLNQDATVFSDTIEGLVTVAKEYPNYGVLSPLHLQGEGNAFDQSFASYFSANPDVVSDLYYERLKEVYDVTCVNAAAWIVRKDCFEKVGGFDPIFFMYGEDVDYCDRVIYHGFSIGIVTSSQVIHFRANAKGNKKESQSIMVKYQSEYRIMLYQMKNINRTFWQKLFELLLMNLKRILAKTIHADIHGIIRQMSICALILLKTPRIFLHVRMSKKGGRVWLQTDKS